MNLYRLEGTESGYDTYDACIVAAESEDAARQISPAGEWGRYTSGSWAAKPEDVTVQLIGTAIEGTQAGVVLASFHAG